MTALPYKPYSGHAGPQKQRATKQHLERDLEKEICTAGFKYSWRKMEAAAQDRAGWRQVACAPPGVTKLKWSQLFGFLGCCGYCWNQF